MGRILAAIVKTILTVVIAAGCVIASFYFAYLILVLLLMGIVGIIAWKFFSRKPKTDWFKYEDY